MIACDEETGAVPDGAPQWTEEQRYAIERREGDLLLDAAAGSGKTSVLVERFVRSVLEDGVAVEAILTITFTEKAAAEMRDRIRARLRALGAHEAARATEAAFISTIHGFCARVLRAHALAAGLDPLHAAALGAQALGRAGDLAARRTSARTIRPMDVVAALPDLWRAWELRAAARPVPRAPVLAELERPRVS